MASGDLTPLTPGARVVRETGLGRTAAQDTVWTVTVTAVTTSAVVAIGLAIGLGSHAQAASPTVDQPASLQPDSDDNVAQSPVGEPDRGAVTRDDGRNAVGGSGGS